MLTYFNNQINLPSFIVKLNCLEYVKTSSTTLLTHVVAHLELLGLATEETEDVGEMSIANLLIHLKCTITDVQSPHTPEMYNN